MSAGKPDPVIAAWERLQAAEKACCAAADQRDEAQKKAREAGFRLHHPEVPVGRYFCMSVKEVRQHGRGLPEYQVAKALEALRDALADWRRQKRKAGLLPFEAAVKRASNEREAAMQAMATTRATTTAGVILKLKLIAREVTDGKSRFGEAIVASAIADLSRIGGRGR